MKTSSRTLGYEQQALALRMALQGLLNQTFPGNGSAAVTNLEALIRVLETPLPSPADQRSLLETAVRTVKDLITAYHEAGHVLAYHALTPRDRVRLDSVCFHGSEVTCVEAGMTYTRISEPWWPDPLRNSEVARELACVLAGKGAEPALGGGVQLNGSDQDDQEQAAELLESLPEKDRSRTEKLARTLTGQLNLRARVPSLAAYLYERWFQGDTVIPIADLGAFLTRAGETR